MVLRFLVLTLLCPVMSALAAIRSYPLDSRVEYTLQISATEPTTCVFPDKLTAIEGALVTTKADDESASVLLSYQPGMNHFSLRALKLDAQGALNVLFRGEVFVLRLRCSEKSPDRSVTFTENSSGQTTASALRSLLQRAKHHAEWSAQYPALASTVERGEPRSITTYKGCKAEIAEVFRFAPEDVIVVRVRLHNGGTAPLRYDPDSLSIRVGSELFPARASDGVGLVAPGATQDVWLAITTTLTGERVPLSVTRLFQVLIPRS